MELWVLRMAPALWRQKLPKTVLRESMSALICTFQTKLESDVQANNSLVVSLLLIQIKVFCSRDLWERQMDIAVNLGEYLLSDCLHKLHFLTIYIAQHVCKLSTRVCQCDAIFLRMIHAARI